LLTQQSLALKFPVELPSYGVLDSGKTEFRTLEEEKRNRTVCLRHIYAQGAGSGVGGVSIDESVWTLQTCSTAACSCTADFVNISAGRNRFLLKFAVVSHLQVGGTTILTLYAAILFTLANFMRSFFSDKRLIIPYIDMPYTLHLYQLVLDIVYARQDNDLEMEEILYNGLTDIYRDQHLLAKWSGERALKLPEEWWEFSDLPEGADSGDDIDENGNRNGLPLREAYLCYPSFANTTTEPYMTRHVE